MCTFLTPLVTALEKNYYDAKTVTVLIVLLPWREFEARSVAVFLLTCHHGAGGGGLDGVKARVVNPKGC